MSEAFVYCWTDNTTGKLYIGKHKGSENDGYVSSSKYLMEEYRKRPEDFTRTIIASGCDADMISLERAILKSTNAASNTSFYNMHNNNGSGTYATQWHTEETKKKLSLSAKKRWSDKEARKRQSDLGKKRVKDLNGFYGKTHTEASKKAMSEKKKKMYVGSGNPNAKSVIYNERVYLTMKDLSKEIGVSMNIVRKMIRNNEVEYML